MSVGGWQAAPSAEAKIIFPSVGLDIVRGRKKIKHLSEFSSHCSAGVQHVHRQGGRQGHAVRRPSAGRPCNEQAQPPGTGASSGQGHQVCICGPSSGAGLHGLRPWDLSRWATLYICRFTYTVMDVTFYCSRSFQSHGLRFLSARAVRRLNILTLTFNEILKEWIC